MTSQERLDKIGEEVEKYLSLHNIPSPKIQEYLDFTSEDLKVFTAEELHGIAFEIQSYAFSIQSMINQKETLVKACQQKIDKLVGPHLSKYEIWGTKEKWIAAIHDNDTALGFYEAMQGPTLILSRLNYWGARLESMAKTLNDLAKAKTYHKD